MRNQRARITLALLVAVAAASWAPLRAAGATPARPNIVFILADDWGWGDLSCHDNKLVRPQEPSPRFISTEARQGGEARAKRKGKAGKQ